MAPPTHQVEGATDELLLAHVDVQIHGIGDHVQVFDGAVAVEDEAAVAAGQHVEHGGDVAN